MHPQALLTAVAGGPSAELTPWLLVGSLTLLASTAAVGLSNRSGLPTLLLYLGIGMAMGSSGLGIPFDDAALAQVLGYGALVLILAEGGLTTDWQQVRPAVTPAALLSTVGVLVSVGVVGAAGHLMLGWSWQVALLVGAILSSTDAAAVFSVLRRVPLPQRLRALLEAESGFNDAPVVLLVTALAAQATPGHSDSSWAVIALEAVLELAGGALVGLVLALLIGRILQRVAPSSSGLFSLTVVGVTVLAYAAADSLHTSGFIATYVAGLTLGNLQLPHRAPVRGIAEAFGLLAQIGLFVMLGLLVDPSHLTGQLVPALVLSVVLVLARYVSVLVSLGPLGFGLREQVFLSWAGLRGAVPVVLATVPLTMGTPHTDWIFDLVFLLVCILTVLQAPTLPWVTARLGLATGATTRDVELESTPLDELSAHVVQVRIGEASRLHGVEVFELRLPTGADVTLVVRDEVSFVPHRRTALRRGDRLLVVTTAAARRATMQRIEAVSEGGRLAGWR